MRKLWLALSLLCLGFAPAWAQNFTMPPPAGVTVGGLVVVASCGSQSLTVGKPAYATIDTTGKLCDGGSGGGTSNITQWATTNLGVPTAWGTAPTGNVIGVNANVLSVASLPLPTGAATSANQATEITSLGTIATNTGSPIPAGTATIGTVGQLPYPVGAVPITISATGTTAATTATLAGTSGKTTYLCSYSVRANATATANVQNTVTGIISGTRTDQMWVPANTAGLGVDEQIFSPCIPASAANTSIAVASGAPGTGGNVTVNAAGYQL